MVGCDFCRLRFRFGFSKIFCDEIGKSFPRANKGIHDFEFLVSVEFSVICWLWDIERSLIPKRECSSPVFERRCDSRNRVLWCMFSCEMTRHRLKKSSLGITASTQTHYSLSPFPYCPCPPPALLPCPLSHDYLLVVYPGWFWSC